ncbi:fibronectin type III domain-containing protein [Candidatus Peregrinibacteria bacterium]|nr:fibronectin type III domain-containing protein [Candidatus Peregrinibacteria bacterium]
MNKIKKYIIVCLALLISLALGNSQIIYAQNSDVLSPSDVENLKSAAGESEVTLTWDPAIDNVGVTGYKIFAGTNSVKTSEDSYNLPPISAGNVTNYVVENLTNGQTYYFSAAAVDAAGNESENYAVETSATPQVGLKSSAIEDDDKAPEVKKVGTTNNETVKVEFSEPIKLPLEAQQSAFKIEKTSDKSQLKIQEAEMDPEDKTGTIVLLTTDPQEDGAEYLLTAGIEIQDFFNNPVVSGVSDTGSFKGSSKQKEKLVVTGTQPPPAAPQGDQDAPFITSAIADYNNRISVSFSEQIVLPNNPKSITSVYKKGTKNALNIINVTLSVDEKTAYIITDPQEAIEYDVFFLGIKDIAGNEMSDKAASVVVKGMAGSLKDLVPPEDVTNLIAKIKDAQKHFVELSWKASKNSAGDLADQLVYQSEGKNASAFGTGTSLGSTTTAVQVEDLKGGRWYTFKITAKDNSGNESKGALKSVWLPETGPGVIAAALSALAMGFYSRKKKK